MIFDHDGSSGNNSSANQAAKIRYQARDRRAWVKRATPSRKNQWANTSRPLANQMPISKSPIPRSKASVEPTVIVAKPALQNSSEG
ncbi:hypothetical protein D3C84_1104080 [compost metagenome]